MGRTLSVTICALLLLMSYASVVQPTELPDDTISHTESTNNPWPFGVPDMLDPVGYPNINGVVEDEQGDVYVSGTFSAPPGGITDGFDGLIFPNSTIAHVSNSYRAFVAKYSYVDGWQWVKVVDSQDEPTHSGQSEVWIALNSQGSAYITGKLWMSDSNTCYDFDLIQICADSSRESGAEYEMFVAKIDPNGNWIWAKNYSHFDEYEHFESATDLYIDANDNLYLTGPYFLMLKLDSSGNVLDTQLHPSQTSSAVKLRGTSIAANSAGDVLIAVNELYNGATYYLSNGESFSAANGQACATPSGYLVHRTSDGQFKWGTTCSSDFGNNIDIEIDPSGSHAVILGSSHVPEPRISVSYIALNQSPVGGNSVGSEWSQGSSAGSFWGSSIGFDSLGHILVTGSYGSCGTCTFYGTTFPQKTGDTSDRDVFVFSLTTSGLLHWVKTGGGGSHDESVISSISPESIVMIALTQSTSITFDDQTSIGGFGISSNKFLVSLAIDYDGDGYSEKTDPFPHDFTQYSDSDGDGFGDNTAGTTPDGCPSIAGNSTIDTYGCVDTDGDGWSNSADPFPLDSTQQLDSDGDGFGDNSSGNNADACPETSGSSIRDRLGCPDSDYDGFSDVGDSYPNDATQWSDEDGDGYGDNPMGINGDMCPGIYGLSTIDRLGCVDTDGDGYSDTADVCPTEIGNSTKDRIGCLDSDGDGYSDEGDGFDDDPSKWADMDGDGVEDSEDAFPFDPTQDTDSDGDGMGDNPMGMGADKFPDDPSQWSDIDGDGYGDNQTGNNSDAFIADPTQHADRDGDGYGDSLSGRLADQFPDNPTQWIDQDGDGLGDNQSGTDADPYLFDFDNDGYNDSIDILPKLASPGDLDNDGCPDEEDAFPTDFKECKDTDGDGEGDTADADDDDDGWTDTDEIREGTDPLDPDDYPVKTFQLVIPGTTIGLDAWDLIGIFGGFPIFGWILFGFITRNSRCRKFEGQLLEASSPQELEEIALRSEYSLMLRLLGPHQGIRLERLRSELDDGMAGETHHVPEILEPEDITEDQTHIVEDEMVTEAVASGPSKDIIGRVAEDGYEWTLYQGANYYRTPNSGADWQTWQDN